MRTRTVKSLMYDEWVTRLLAEGPLSARELSERMFSEMWEAWAESEGLGGMIEWRTDAEPLLARLLASGWAKDRGQMALHGYQLQGLLPRMERRGLVERVQIPGHRPMLWRLVPEETRP